MSKPIYYPHLIQGSDQWLEARMGIITASEVHKLVTPKGDVANNKDSRGIVFATVAERLTKRLGDNISNKDTERGHAFEPFAIDYYEKHYEPVTTMGFVTRQFDHPDLPDGFIIGYSPDGIVSDYGLVEVKCPARTKHISEICQQTPPTAYMMQMQTGMLVTGHQWCDYIAYHNGLRPRIVRVTPNKVIMDKILEAAANLEVCVLKNIELYHEHTAHEVDVSFIEGELVE